MSEIITIKDFLEPSLKKFTKEQLYGAVRTYLETRIIADEDEVKKIENSVVHEVFAICEKEIIEREIADDNERRKTQGYVETRSEYLTGFGDLLVRAGIIKSHPYGITDRRMIN